MQKKQSFLIKGMNRDMSASKLSSEYAYEIKNMRIFPTTENTLMSMVNEKGNKLVGIYTEGTEVDENGNTTTIYTENKNLYGTPIGQAIINDTLVLFMTNCKDRNNNEDSEEDEENSEFGIDTICKYDFIDDKLVETRLYNGNLNFSTEYPIDTIVYFENEDLQKVYWTDGINQPRVINIAALKNVRDKWDDTTFDFIREITGKEEFEIEKMEGGGGLFAPGALQYAITYSNKYLQETNIIYQSPLYYTSYPDRGGSPEDSVSNSFKITIRNIDTRFDYLNIYSILRTSIDATPSCKLISSILTENYTTQRIFKSLSAGQTFFSDASNLYNTSDTEEFNKNFGTLIYLRKSEDGTYVSLNDSGIEPSCYEESASYHYQYQINSESYDYDMIIFSKHPSSYSYNTSISYIELNYNEDTEKYSFGELNIYIYKNGRGGAINFYIYEESSEINVYYTENVEDSTAIIIDNGLIGESVDPTELLYKGGIPIKVKTLEQKDNTLFLGNITLEDTDFDYDFKQQFKQLINNFDFTYKEDSNYKLPYAEAKGIYAYTNQLNTNSNNIKTFKYNEYYRIGLQAQYKSGYWSEVVFIGDVKNTKHIKTIFYEEESPILIKGELTIEEDNEEDNEKDNKGILSELVSKGYIKIRPMIVYPTINDRECICQGVLCPTVFNFEDRYTNSPFAQSSWFTRIMAPFDVETLDNIDFNTGETSDFAGGDTLSKYNITHLNNSYLETLNKDYIGVNRIINPYEVCDQRHIDNSFSQLLFERTSFNLGTWVEFRHNYPIGYSNHENGEIQNNIATTFKSYTPTSNLSYKIEDLYKGMYIYNEEETADDFVQRNSMNFGVDQSIVTLHSPDIEFDDQVQNLDLTNLKLRIIGVVPITAQSSDIDVQTSTPAIQFKKENDDQEYWDLNDKLGFYTEIAPGFYSENISTNHGFAASENQGESLFAWRGLVQSYWIDEVYDLFSNNSERVAVCYPIYPWHRNGSLNNQANANKDGYTYAMLDKKKMSNMWFSYKTEYSDNVWTPYNGISGVAIFNSQEQTLTQLPAPENSNLPKINYYGNVDKLLVVKDIPSCEDFSSQSTNKYSEDIVNGTGYPLMATYRGNITGVSNGERRIQSKHTATYELPRAWLYNIIYSSSNNNNSDTNCDRVDSASCFASSPIRIKYKSTPHAVMAFNYTPSNEQTILPSVAGAFNSYNAPSNGSTSYKKFWDDANATKVAQSALALYRDTNRRLTGDFDINYAGSGIQYGYLWLGELYRDENDVQLRFGGDTEEALANNVWIPCGEAVSIINENGEAVDKVTIDWTEGDTYYQRYDHIKTYPFTLEDQNSVTDIISFMCETRINLDGRYDRNRGQVSYLAITPENFNQVNMAYSQENNFFTYHTLNSNLINLDNFHNSITWTKTKVAGELIDTWTNITLASTLDLDGDKGSVNALKRFNNNLIAFQDTGISQIKYNENVQLAVTEGVPVELANSGKVDGKDYLTNQMGCTNKWSIKETPNGLYFIDNLTKSIYLYNGQFTNLTDNMGFSSWIAKELGDTKDWNSVEFGDFISYYDRINNDVMFINRDNCLGFSEVLGTFSSFYDYEYTPYMANIGDKFLSIRKNENVDTDETTYSIWLQHGGEYNNFFGKYKPFWFTVIANDGMVTDKTFDTIEYRADTFEVDSNSGENIEYQPNESFDHLQAWDEYQKSLDTPLSFAHHQVTNLKKKFKIWRANIPRDNIRKRDRIRNPWAYLKLSKQSEDNHKTILHDLQVIYYDNTPVGMQVQQKKEE